MHEIIIPVSKAWQRRVSSASCIRCRAAVDVVYVDSGSYVYALNQSSQIYISGNPQDYLLNKKLPVPKTMNGGVVYEHSGHELSYR